MPEKKNKRNKLIRLVGVYAHEKDGFYYFRGNALKDVFIPAGAEILILPNKFREKGSRSPDKYIFMKPMDDVGGQRDYPGKDAQPEEGSPVVGDSENKGGKDEGGPEF